MKRFNYKARDKKNNRTVKGTIQADSEREAGKLLIAQGFIPDKVEEEGANNPFAKFTDKVKTKDRIVFTRQFATLIGAGLPLSNSLRTVAAQTESKPMRAVIEDVLASVEAGKSLSEALKKHPDVFNNVYLSLVAAGEMSGTLDYSLERLATQEEKDSSMMSKIKGAMVYPAIILVVIIAVLAFMMIAVVPQVEMLYEDMGEELPGLTQFLVGITNFFASFWWIVVVAVGVLVFLFVQFKKTETGIMFFAKFKLEVPLFKGLFQRLYMTRFARTMEMLLATGVAMLDAMQISAKATANEIVEGEIIKASEKVKSGKPLSEALRDKEHMLPLIPQMASIGEESGKIDEMLGKASQVYENELDEMINNISTMIEPILMVVMAALIGVVVGGTLLPIYSLVSSVS